MAEVVQQVEDPVAPSSAGEAVDLGTVLAAAALVLCAFPVVAMGFDNRLGPYMVQAYLFWSDLPLMALGLLYLPDLVRRLLARRLDIVTGLTVLVAALAVSWAVHPSIRGGLQLLRFLGVAGAVLSISRCGPIGRRLLVGALAGLTTMQVLLATIQRARGGPAGLEALGEQPVPLVPIGGSVAPQGTLVHPYVLAGLAVVTIGVLAAVALRRPGLGRACAALAGVAGIAVGLTYSRTALVALAGMVAAILFSVRSRPTRAAALTVLAAVLVGFTATAVVVSGGWVGRAQETAGNNLTSGRTELARQSFALIRRQPLVGVGTGRYVLAVEEEPAVAQRSTRVLQPVHVVPLLLVAEGGIAAAAALVVLAIAMARAAARAGAAGWALLLSFLPFLLLDHFAVTFPQGLVLTVAWLASLAVVGAPPDPAEPELTAGTLLGGDEAGPVPVPVPVHGTSVAPGPIPPEPSRSVGSRRRGTGEETRGRPDP